MSKSNSSYTPFARKYRPSKFSELLGQEVLVKTLTYCIQNNRLAQAHLLTGIRGVGKTSSARIIAKTVNCTDLQLNKEQITSCDKCKNCESFNKHSHPDIIEIDAASKTSVDDIREIIESSEYRPLLGRMKFFIIDEIHMLSKSAFNALLKVIEEPPEHVIFIFATTEVQKIPLTVISRCQRYDLRRLTFDEIHSLVSNIAKSENIAFEEEALKIIAIKSEGSARDAVTMIDQAASYVHNASKSDVVTAEIIGQMLGLLGTNTILKFTQLIIANDPSGAINLLEDIYAKANSLEYFVQTMADFMAELSKSKVIPNYHNPLYQSYSTEISDILIGTSLSRITILWQIFSNGVSEIKQSHNELVMAQMLIIKAIYACNLPSAEDIMDAGDNLATQPPVIAIDSTQKKVEIEVVTPADEIFEFLKYCHDKTDMETYYLLLNEVEVKEFEAGRLALAGNINITIAAHIEKLLESWSGKSWKVQISKQDKIISLKEKMLDKARQAGDYQVIKNKFPDANISDIILK
ncbi:MAG: DNA polymerase III subunit gamma/tau [Rickettsiaceae bacterium]|nr:DNA polymerase III subunit gamma/tau [Rickettsiaceae bacterium]MDP4832661.1 DNA polymerase III subunit gamma/tau [Rickettsiaceae bacterium]MDP5020281.1 DNA polymerase III subunit gamma/tau [Rickettsiaceae bacterium]MDP5083702.1 DNA polymerase III subunit gamma/tau [Rickettsiaceae bacterium]